MFLLMGSHHFLGVTQDVCDSPLGVTKGVTHMTYNRKGRACWLPLGVTLWSWESHIGTSDSHFGVIKGVTHMPYNHYWGVTLRSWESREVSVTPTLESLMGVTHMPYITTKAEPCDSHWGVMLWSWESHIWTWISHWDTCDLWHNLTQQFLIHLPFYFELTHFWHQGFCPRQGLGLQPQTAFG